MTLDSWLANADDDPSGFWFQSFAASLFFPRAQVWGEVAAVARADTNFAGPHFSEARDRDSILGDPGSRFIWSGGRLAGAFPPAPDQDEYDSVRTSRVETLVVSGSLDVAIPAQFAKRELMPHLPNGHQVILRDFGHTTDVWTEQTRASTHLINTYLDHGRVDTSLYKHRKIDFEPSVTQAALAKGLAGSMVGFALITVLAPVDAAPREEARRIGARKSVLLRRCSRSSSGSAAGSWSR